MSLGSKELFHSNFLHWISLVNWDGFLKIMHGLAGLGENDKFWWETECKIEGFKGKYCPENNNLEVRREYHNFDLSIYILDSVKSAKEEDYQIDIENNENKELEEYIRDSKGARKIKKWIPVLVLENKMKSLPHKEQLRDYSKRAFDEWRTGKTTKDAIRHFKEGPELEFKVDENWILNHGVSFILLSLMPTTIEKSFPQELFYQKNKLQRKLIFPINWIFVTYEKLMSSLRAINPFSIKKDLDVLVVKDYIGFISSMCSLAKVWMIEPNNEYRFQVSPWAKDLELRKKMAVKNAEFQEYKKLRIHDIHEKLIYDQLLVLLEKELQNNNIRSERFDSQMNDAHWNDGVKVFTRSDYAHGIGIFEAQFYLLKSEKLKKEGYLKLIIQVQGDRYCRMVICDDISKGEKRVNEVMINNVGTVVEKIWNRSRPAIQDSLGQYISINHSNPTFPWASQQVNWGKYGDNNIYQYVDIPYVSYVNDVIKAIVADIKMIDGWIK
jgi:hypothetical protein